MKTEEYVRAMRLALCAEEVRDERGDLNHAYFLSKKNCYWGKVQEKALLEALAKHPVGDWAQFRKSPVLEKFHGVELELRVCMLLKVKELGEHAGKRLNAEQLHELWQA